MSVADWSGSLLEWERELGLWKSRLGPVFGRREVRETGSAFLDGLLSGIARKTGWMMAEQAGLSRPSSASARPASSVTPRALISGPCSMGRSPEPRQNVDPRWPCGAGQSRYRLGALIA